MVSQLIRVYMQEMTRILFKKGEQRKFLDLVVLRANCLSLRGILQFGLEVSYSSLKNYYSGRRTLPESLFEDLCHLAKINKKNLRFSYLNDRWGQVKGGRQ